MKARVVICCLAFGAMAARAYWIDTPLEQLAAQSDCVVIGRVTGLQPNTNTLRVQVTMSELVVLKGIESVGATITFDAPYTLFNCVVFTVKADQALQSDEPSTVESNGVQIINFKRFLAGNLPQTVARPSPWRSGELVVTHLDSFQTNETCAVLLRKNPHNSGTLQLVTDDDGKFTFDAVTDRLGKSKTSQANLISRETFSATVKASPPPVTPTVTVVPAPLPPVLIPTNLPIQLILPRAITR